MSMSRNPSGLYPLTLRIFRSAGANQARCGALP